jgi:hypothetical protein
MEIIMIENTTKRKPRKKSYTNFVTNMLSIQEQIHQTAYNLYVKRGCLHGYDLADWLTAEQLVIQQRLDSANNTQI